MRRPALACTLVLVGMAVLAGPVAAQSVGRGRFVVDLSTPAIQFPTPGVADFDAGWIDHPGLLVSVDSRPPSESWELYLRAESPSLGGYGKPLDDILWRVEGSSTWLPLSTADELVVQGQGDLEVVVYFRMRLAWDTDLPDTYAVDLTFTGLRI